MAIKIKTPEAGGRARNPRFRLMNPDTSGDHRCSAHRQTFTSAEAADKHANQFGCGAHIGKLSADSSDSSGVGPRGGKYHLSPGGEKIYLGNK